MSFREQRGIPAPLKSPAPPQRHLSQPPISLFNQHPKIRLIAESAHRRTELSIQLSFYQSAINQRMNRCPTIAPKHVQNSSNPLFPTFPHRPNNALFLVEFHVRPQKRIVSALSPPHLSPVLPCQAFFLFHSSQPPDSKPNRVSALLRVYPPPICYPEYRSDAGGLHPPILWANVGARNYTANVTFASI
jgi:hypothetical protein